MFEAVLMCFSPGLGVGCRGRGAVGFSKRLVHNLPVQFFTLRSSKFEVFET